MKNQRPTTFSATSSAAWHLPLGPGGLFSGDGCDVKPTRIVVEYCSACGYERRAKALASHLSAAFGVEAELVRSRDGAFEITANDVLIFSKHETGRFPSEDEVVEDIEDEADSVPADGADTADS